MIEAPIFDPLAEPLDFGSMENFLNSCEEIEFAVVEQPATKKISEFTKARQMLDSNKGWYTRTRGLVMAQASALMAACCPPGGGSSGFVSASFGIKPSEAGCPDEHCYCGEDIKNGVCKKGHRKGAKAA